MNPIICRRDDINDSRGWNIGLFSLWYKFDAFELYVVVIGLILQLFNYD